MKITLAEYAFYCSLILFVLYVFFVNRTNPGKRKVKDKPKISPLTIFKGKNGFDDEAIRKHFKIN